MRTDRPIKVGGVRQGATLGGMRSVAPLAMIAVMLATGAVGAAPGRAGAKKGLAKAPRRARVVTHGTRPLAAQPPTRR